MTTGSATPDLTFRGPYADGPLPRMDKGYGPNGGEGGQVIQNRPNG